MRKSKREFVCSLFGYKVAHGSTVNEDVDRSVVEHAFESEGFLGPIVAKAADLECVLGMCVYLGFGPGIQKKVWCYRAYISDLQGGLGFPED